MNNINKRFITLLMTIVAIILVLFVVLERDYGTEEAINEVEEIEYVSNLDMEKVNKKAPYFELDDLEGNKISLSDYEDKIIFLNFWATWCGYCDQEMPNFQRILEENDDVVVLSVNVRENKMRVKEYIEDEGYTFKMLLDETGEIGLDYVVGELPATYIIDKDGNIVDNINEMMDYDQMNRIIKTIRDKE